MCNNNIVIFSFHYRNDNWRVAQVKNIGKVEGNSLVTENRWEEVKRKGDSGIKKWIDDNLKGRSCTVVLVGQNTAGRKWVNYEIKTSWNDGKGLIGIYINGLKDGSGNTSTKGDNPFNNFSVNGEKLSKIVKCYTPEGRSSTDKYDWIKQNIECIIEEAIRIRG